jgi:hypothetical protein
MTTGNWDDFISNEEASGYVTGDVAETWNDYAAQSDHALDNAADSIQANDNALYEAASHIGTDPDAFNAAAGQAEDSFNATFQNQLASMGLGEGVEVPGQGDLGEFGNPWDDHNYDSQIDGS